jgi:MFS family permease
MKIMNGQKQNLIYYKWISYLNAGILFWIIQTLYYNYRGLSFFEIAALQSIGSIITSVLEIPSGWLADKLGYPIVLRISSIAYFLAAGMMIISDHFYLFLIAEICFAVASSFRSGTETALLYESMQALGKESEYTIFLSGIRGKQAVIRFFVRLITPVLFAFLAELPFAISLGMYLIIVIFTFCYHPPEVSKELTNKSNETQEPDQTKAKSSLKEILSRNRTFIVLSIISAFVLILVSNYSQYIGPYLQALGLDVKYLGVVLAFASLGEYLGSKLVAFFQKLQFLKVLLFLGIIMSFAIIAAGILNSVLGSALVYITLNLCHTPFTIILSKAINDQINNKYRATLLSVSNQIDEVFGVLADPILGIGIDLLGFGVAYIYLGVAELLVLLVMLGLFMHLTKKKAKL